MLSITYILVLESKSPPKNLITLSILIIPIINTAKAMLATKNHFVLVFLSKLCFIRNFNLNYSKYHNLILEYMYKKLLTIFIGVLI